ncbi:MAG: cyclopropane-fatty-acyl-phospholipid synthase family protein [Chloroflexota bacterium]
MTVRFHEIAEAHHRILNPFTQEKLALLGEVCRLEARMRQLDLACGKGEMLCQWAARHRISGIGVDLSTVFLDAARVRADELGVADRVRFEHADASTYRPEHTAFDLVSCIGATWIGGGLAGTVELLRPALRRDGLILIGEPYWKAEPPEEALAAFQLNPEDFVSLAATADRLAGAGVELVEMVLADEDCWDRYVAAQWWTLDRWLRANPRNPDAPAVRQFRDESRRTHLTYGRHLLGWGVFVGRLGQQSGAN